MYLGLILLCLQLTYLPATSKMKWNCVRIYVFCLTILCAKIRYMQANSAKRKGNCRLAFSESCVSVDPAFQQIGESCSEFCEICFSLVNFD